jgi:hypothetical protein
MKTIETIAIEMREAIANKQNSDDYGRYDGEFAIRSVNHERIHKIGDKLENSHVWVDGVKTPELLCGTCGVHIKNDGDDVNDIIKAMETALWYDDVKCGNHQLLLIYGRGVNGGIDRDYGEICLAYAEVLYVVNNTKRRLK